MVVLLPCKFTLLQNLKRGLKLLPVHVSQDFQLHLIISPPFCRKHIDYHIYARLFNYPAILHLFKCLNRHLKLLPAQNARNYTTPKPNLVLVFAFLGFIALWIYTTPKPQKRIFEAATSACITGLSIASYHIAFLLSKTYWLPYLCKFVQLPCNFAPLQPLKETTEVATGAKVSQIHYSKTTTLSCPFTVSFTTLWIYTTPKPYIVS